jgi:hypothetical protein
MSNTPAISQQCARAAPRIEPSIDSRAVQDNLRRYTKPRAALYLSAGDRPNGLALPAQQPPWENQ